MNVILLNGSVLPTLRLQSGLLRVHKMRKLFGESLGVIELDKLIGTLAYDRLLTDVISA